MIGQTVSHCCLMNSPTTLNGSPGLNWRGREPRR